MDENKALRKKLEQTLVECDKLREENRHLQELIDQHNLRHPDLPPKDQKREDYTPTITNHSSTAEKIALFRNLFRGREDVYPVRWETKKGKSGYSPACRLEWDRAFCDKPRIKCDGFVKPRVRRGSCCNLLILLCCNCSVCFYESINVSLSSLSSQSR